MISLVVFGLIVCNTMKISVDINTKFETGQRVWFKENGPLRNLPFRVGQDRIAKCIIELRVVGRERMIAEKYLLKRRGVTFYSWELFSSKQDVILELCQENKDGI